MPKTRHICRASLGAVLLLGLWVTSPAADDASDCQSRDPETSIRACTNLLKTRKLDGSNRAKIYVLRGLGFARTGNHETAIGDYGQAIKIFPRRIDPHYLRGISHAAIGNAEAAITDFDTVISLDPNHADALTQRGRVLLEVGDVDSAIADFSAAIAKGDPPDAYFGRARAYVSKREFSRAISDLDVAIAIVPNNPELIYHRGVANAEAGNLDAALADFGSVIAIDPRRAEVYDARGQIYAHAGNDALAIADFGAAIALDPGRVDSLNHRARAYMRAGDPDRATADFDAAIAAGPDFADAYYGRALVYMSKGEPRRAIEDLDAALAIVPDHPGLLYHRGVAYADAGDLDAALADYDRVVEIQPDHPEVYYYRGLAYARKGFAARAVDDFDRMLDIDPNHAGALHHRSLARQKVLEANESFRAAILAEDPEPENSSPRTMSDIFREGISATDPEFELLCLQRSAVPRAFPPAPEGWSVDEVQVTELEPAMREMESFLEALGSVATGRVVNETPRVRLRAVRTYSNGANAIKVTIDTDDLEGLGLIAVAHEKEDVKAKLAAEGLEAETVRGHRALVKSSEPQLAAIRVGENGLISLECTSAECEADLTALIDRIDFAAVERFAGCDHRAEASVTAE